MTIACKVAKQLVNNMQILTFKATHNYISFQIYY